jgi:hypothetical protein
MPSKSMVAAMAVILSVAGASIASAGRQEGGSHVITLTTKTTGFAFVENGRPGVNPGDRFVAASDLLRGNRKVGEAGTECTLIRVVGSTSRFECAVTSSLPHGQVTLQSLISLTPGGDRPYTFAVTGGTGRYRTARGDATLSGVSPTDQTGEVTIRLR